MTEFVEDWTILHTLGEGAFGEVKLLVHRVTGDAVAMKIVNCDIHKDAAETVRKEVCIHRLLSHPNVIRYYGQRKEGSKEYIFMEYASGGELFNKIEPDVGMNNKEVQYYFKQLLQGIEYMHGRGVAHRDIKPENLLLDHNNILKITDFGMATLFRMKGRERKLDKRCGTLPYIAPEVFISQPYRAQPADLWSCGVVLLAMLAGELPWDQATKDQIEYINWVTSKYMVHSPWNKLDNMALSLIRCILEPDPKNRIVLEKIMKHRWMQQNFRESVTEKDVVDGREEKKVKRLCSDKLVSPESSPTKTPMGLSQPVMYKEGPSVDQVASILEQREATCFSQPTHFDDLIVHSQLQFTQSIPNTEKFDKLVRRMTRFFVKGDCENVLAKLGRCLDKSGYSWNTDISGKISISTVDKRKMPLVFKADVINMDGKLLLDFRLSKGCGLEFKRRFLRLKNGLQDLILE